MTRSLSVLVLAVSIASGAAMAADFDGSKKLICAPVTALDCADGVSECVSGTPQELGAPAFIRVDFERNEVTGPQRTTAIRQIDKSESQLLLQGMDAGLAWTMAINSGSGRMYATIAGQDGAIILSGSCTTL